MFRLTRPSATDVALFVASQGRSAFTYPEVGATRSGPAPSGYVVDRNRVRLGAGAAAFERAVASLTRWRMLAHGWAFVAPAEPPIVPGTTVAVVASHYGFSSLNACRIVYVLDGGERDAAGVRRAGFGYGTLADHGAIGEERFSVEWHSADDSVWFDLYAFSRPGNATARVGYPFGRRLQRRFARAAKQAMVDAVDGDAPRADA